MNEQEKIENTVPEIKLINKIDDQYYFKYHQYEYNKAIDYFEEAIKIAVMKNNITLESIVSSSRTRENVMARGCVYKFIRENTKASLKWIGKRFEAIGGIKRDHATVLHGIRQLNNLMEVDMIVERDYRSFENACRIAISKKYNEKYGKEEKVFNDHPEMEFVAHNRNDRYKRIIFTGYTLEEISHMINQFGQFHEEYKLEPFSTSGLKIFKM